MYFQDLILTLQRYWADRGCLLIQPYDMEKGAATFNPATWLRALGPEPYSVAWAEPCRRPTDGRYGENPIRMQHYYQFQVILKPCPTDILDLYIGSLAAIGITQQKHDIRLVHDDWESPTLGAWGLGWEVWVDGMEVTQFTYFQQVGGIDLTPITGEITYGLERLCMYLQGVDNVFKLQYNSQLTYGDVFHQNEVQCSRYNFELADIALHQELFQKFEAECLRVAATGNPFPAADYCLKASHAFNLLDARGAISVNERQAFILRVRTLARTVAEAWLRNREELGYPLLRDPVPLKDPLLELAEEAEQILKKKKSEALDSHIESEQPAQVPPGRWEDGIMWDVAAPPESAQPARVPLLIELGVEEMPAQVFGPLLRQLPQLFDKFFGNLELDPRDIAFYVTPRRIVCSAASIASRQPDHTLELKGPPVKVARDAAGNWTKAAEGWCRKVGLSLDRVETREIGGAEYLYAEQHKPGRPATEVLSEAIPAFLKAIHWYKTMRWGDGTGDPFVRPVKWLVALAGDRVVPCAFGGVASGNVSRGHRFMAPGPVTVPAVRDAYLAAMREAWVIVDQQARCEEIRRQVEATAAEHGLSWRVDQPLLMEVSHLVEYPFAVLCEFPKEMLEVPELVLVSEMKEHQKQLALLEADGTLSNRFIGVSNMRCADMSLVRKGYRDVICSRFADARFFLREDKKRPLAARVRDLGGVVFQEQLGTILDKVRRIGTLSRRLSDLVGLPLARRHEVEQIAELCKADLTTLMVYEFPELQGEIGRYYALAEGLPPVVCDGIRDHYYPKGMSDELPGSDEAAIVAIADRIDTLVGIFAIGKAPTSSSDPFALRRACLGTIAIIVNRGFHLDIETVLRHSLALFGDKLRKVDPEALIRQLMEFYFERARRLFAEPERAGVPVGFASDTIAAVMGATLPWSDFADLVARLRALAEFRRRDGFASVAATFKRCSNILEQVGGDLDPSSLTEPAERELLAAVEQTEKSIAARLAARDYVGAMDAVGPLRVSVDAFFDALMVNDPDPGRKASRHRLLGRVVHLVLKVADFAQIQDPG